MNERQTERRKRKELHNNDVDKPKRGKKKRKKTSI